jgi:threonine aldolase
MIFASDNWAGASPRVIDALAAAAASGHPAYGADDITKAVERRFSELFERDVTVLLVASGTVANALSLSAYARPGGVVFCHDHAHIAVDEAGATSFFGGGITLTTLAGESGKLAPPALFAAIEKMRDHTPHTGQPIAVSLTEITELGAAYQPDEVRAIADIAHASGCAVHMDGARFANAVAALGVSPADITWRAGVDVLSFGGTKNGCIAAEAVVFFDPAPVRDAVFQRQRAGQGFSKNWFIAAQLDAYLTDNHWLELAGHANAMAARLAAAISASGNARLALKPDGNEIFAVLSKAADQRLKATGAVYYPWSADTLPRDARPDADEVSVRLICSWQTCEDDVDRFTAVLARR